MALSPFRCLGNICGDVPVSYTLLYGEPVLMVATGKSFLLYRGKELSLLRGGPTFEHDVSAVAQSGKHRVVGEGATLHCFSHHKLLWSSPHSSLIRALVKLVSARDDLVVSYGTDHMIAIRHVKTGELLHEFPVQHNRPVTSMHFLESYSNKLFLTTADGYLQLYNMKTGKLLVDYSVAERRGTTTAMATQVLCATCSPYRDIVAFGTSDGRLVVFNMGTLEEVCSFRHDDVAVTSVTFRADKDGFLVSGTSAGEVAIWDVANRCLDGVLTRSKQVTSRLDAFDTPHTEAVHSLMAFPKGAIVVSASSDNALMQFRFDTVDGLGLLVRERRGHMGSCTAVRFYNTDLLVTAGDDQAVRATHVFSDRANWEMSQGKLGQRGRDRMIGRETLKLPRVTRLETNPTRNYQWGSVASLHEGSALLCTWRMDTRALENKLSGISTGMHEARSIAISSCGNFAVVGYSSGNLTRINLQNKSIKQFFEPTASKTNAPRAHMASVEAVEIGVGNTVVVSAGLDGNMMLWDLIAVKHVITVPVGDPVTLSCLHEPSSLFIAAQRFTIRVYSCRPDSEVTGRAVRSFTGHRAPITAMALAPDTQRHVFSTSADATLMISDLSAGVCVGVYQLASPVTSMSFHPDALFLATTHLGEKGAFLWTNNLRYGYAAEAVEDPVAFQEAGAVPWLHYPSSRRERDNNNNGDGRISARAADDQGAGHSSDDDEDDDVELFDARKDHGLAQQQRAVAETARLDSLDSDGLRYSGLPRSVWYNLTVVDQIREKNQPILPPKQRDVPFFLPTTNELRPTFLVQASATAATQSAPHFYKSSQTAYSAAQQLIVDGKYADAMALLKTKSATEIDFELRTIVDFVEGAEYQPPERAQMRLALMHLLGFLETGVASEDNVDLVQAMVASVVKAHGPLLTKCDEGVLEKMKSLAKRLNETRALLQQLVGYPNCLLGQFTGSAV